MTEADPPPRKIALFSGHMIDAPGRETPRFAADKAPIAAREIGKTLDELAIGAADLAICGGACGGDLMFAEAALARGARLEIFLPFEEETFLGKSIDFAGPEWRDRFFAAKARAVVRIAPRDLGPLREGEDPYERENEWMLASALRFGPDKVDFVCLWNGEAGDGPGGARHMMDAVRDQGGRTHWIDTTKLWT